MISILRLAAVLVVLTAALPAQAGPFMVPAKPVAETDLLKLSQGLQFSFGVSEGTVLRALRRQGFTDIKITYRGMTKARAEACRDGERFATEITPGGDIRRAAKIGECGRGVPIKRAKRNLEDRGFNKIDIRPVGGGFVATACRQGERFRVSLNRRGNIRSEQPIGRCGRRLNERDVAEQLRHWGYSRVRVTRVQNGRFSAEACNNDNRVKLRLTRGGQIERERRIGRCDPALHPAHIATHLASKGLSRVEVVDSQLPRYVAHACRADRRVEVAMNRFGEIIEERPIGYCAPPVTADYIIETLRNMGYGSVRIVREGPGGFVAEGCQAANKVELKLSIYGETIRQRHLGPCPSPQIEEVLAEFQGRGLRDARMIVTGCRRGQRVRIELDRYGNPVETKLRGPCR